MKIKRLISAALVLIMLFSLSPLSVLAEETAIKTEEAAVAEETASEESATEVEESDSLADEIDPNEIFTEEELEGVAAETEVPEEELAVSVNEESALKAYEILTGTGILPNAPKTDAKTVSRGDFAAMIAKIADLDTVIGSETGYRDVPATNKNFSAVSLAVSNGWMSGNKGLFKPDDPITFADACRALVGMLGRSGGISGDTAFTSRANSLGLLTGIKVNKNGEISGAVVCKMLENALGATYLEADKLANDSLIYSNMGELMTAVHEISVIEGVLTQTRATGLNSAEKCNGVVVDDVLCETETDYSDFLGMNVECYVKNDGKDREVMYIRATNDNIVINLITKDIENLKNKEILYYTDPETGEESCEMEMSSATPVIYNGSYGGSVNNYTSLQLMLKNVSGSPESAKMKLIDNDDDGEADAIIIWQYDTYFITKADTPNMFYRDSYNNTSLNLKDFSDAQIRITTNDSEGAITDIRVGSVISVAKSADEKLIDIYVKSDVIYDGVVEEMRDNEIKISGTWYERSAYYDELFTPGDGERDKLYQLKLGQVGTVYLDFLNRIVFGKMDTGLNYAYMTGIEKKKGIGDIYKMRLFVFDKETKESEFKVYELAERFSLDGAAVKSKDIKQSKLYNDAETVNHQLVKYKVNTDGKISHLLTADTRNTQTSLNFNITDPWYRTGEFELNFLGNLTWNTNLTCLGNKYRVFDEDTMVLTIPTDVTNDNGFAVAKSGSGSFSNNTTYNNLELYDVDRAGYVNVIIRRSDAGASVSWSGVRTLIVDTVSNVLNADGEVVQKISGYSFESESWLRFRKTKWEYLTTSDLTYAISTPMQTAKPDLVFDAVKPGDIIRYNKNAQGDIKNVRLEFRYSKDIAPISDLSHSDYDKAYEEGYLNGTRYGAPGSYCVTGYGKLAYYTGGNTMFGLSFDGGSGFRSFRRTSTSPFVVFDTEKKEMELLDDPEVYSIISDGVAKASDVWILSVYGQVPMVVVYK